MKNFVQTKLYRIMVTAIAFIVCCAIVYSAFTFIYGWPTIGFIACIIVCIILGLAFSEFIDEDKKL